ncbi:MAG: helix-turn-helix domain-containing protein [Ruminiclostridium sp.]|nr:helix-turn-helix domain-containing protein [Ruminiclostridium sp.]
MVRHTPEGVTYAPLYIHSFQLLLPHHQAEAEKFNSIDPDKIASTGDKLRYFRYKKALFQREVADYAGLDRSTYIRFESGMDFYPPDKLYKIAELLEVDISDLLDGYNTFIHNGQGQQIRAIRKRMKLTQKEFGKRFGAHAGKVKRWEKGKARIFRSTWIKLFSKMAIYHSSQ